MQNEFETVKTEYDVQMEAWQRRMSEVGGNFHKFKEHALQDPREAITKARADKEVLAGIGKAVIEDGGEVANLRDELLKKGATKKELGELEKIGKKAWEALQDQKPTPASSTSTSTKPLGRVINTNAQLSTILGAARKALDEVNDPPVLFRRGNAVARTIKAQGGLQIQTLEGAAMLEHLSHAASWYYMRESTDEDGVPGEAYEHVFPPRQVAEAVLASPSETLPELARVATTPFFDKEGVLVTEEGYHAGAKTFMALGKGLAIPPVPPVPSAEQVEAAKALLEELVCDFLFDKPADKTHYMALLFEPFVRPMIFGRSPLHVLEAPEAGSGKSLLGHVTAYVATGEAMPYRPYPTQEEEREKSVMSALLAGGLYVAFDNVKVTVDSPSLEAALTTRYPHARRLGVTKDVVAENNASWVITLNNGSLSRDIGRRAVRTRVDTKTDRPEKRDATLFRHPNLEQWVAEHRNDLIHSILVLVQSWISAGKAPFFKTKASFESWSSVLGGILSHAGFVDFLDETTEDAMVVTDLPRAEGEEFVEAWFQKFGYRAVTAKELHRLAAPPEVFKTKDPVTEEVLDQERPCREPKYLSGVLSVGQPGGRPQRMANWLLLNKSRVLGGRIIEEAGKDAHLKVQTYKLVDPVSPGSAAPLAPVVSDAPEF